MPRVPSPRPHPPFPSGRRLHATHGTGALAVEEPWLANALHLTSQGTQAVTAEADIALNQTFGVKLDLPGWNPSSHALSSTAGAGLKIRLRGPCRTTVSASYFAAEVEDQYDNRTNLASPASGDSITGRLVWAITRRGAFPRRSGAHHSDRNRRGRWVVCQRESRACDRSHDPAIRRRDR